MKIRRLIRPARWTVKATFLALFLYLVTSARHPLETTIPADLYLRLDPLVQLSATLAARQIAPFILWAVPLILLAVLFRRLFCGWICPMGTTLDLFRLRRFNAPPRKHEATLRRTKYLLLAALLTAAAAGSAFLAWLDPITAITRTFAVYLYPAFNSVLTGAMFALYGRGVLPDLAVWADTELRGNLLPVEQPIYRLSWLFLLIFAAIVALNLVAHRFWCRYLCPLGALFALISRPAPFGRRLSSAACGKCGRCQAQCGMGAIEGSSYASDGAECIMCGDCYARCPDSAISFGIASPSITKYDPSRRQLFALGGFAALGVAGLRVDSPPEEVYPFMVRPPGAGDDFLQKCVRCGQCIKSCPSSGLQPSLLQAGLEGLWTPILVSRIGPCNYDCHSCGLVCPTSAIERLTLKQKQETIIGTAYIDQKRCIPWVDGRSCIVCEELCPVSPKAVVLDPAEVVDEGGKRTTVKRPRIDRPRCIGCGICEQKCPLPAEAAIRVYNTNALLSQTGDVSGEGGSSRRRR